MKKILRFTITILFSGIFGAVIFSIIIAESLYFPETRSMARDTWAGLSLEAYQYEPWLWNREKITVINIHDRKNDASNVEYKLKGEVNNIRLIHSGEDFALIVYSDPNFSSMESAYVVYRSPKSESENSIEEIHVGGNIIAVAPDESGYFYISGNKIYKRNWQGETIISANIEMDIEPILDVQQIGVSGRMSNHPVLFFSNNTKIAFRGTSGSWRDGYVFIWDLGDNKIDKIPSQSLGNYNSLGVEDDKLYIERRDSSVSKKLIVAE